jgi:hypothetical protein
VLGPVKCWERVDEKRVVLVNGGEPLHLYGGIFIVGLGELLTSHFLEGESHEKDIALDFARVFVCVCGA